MPDKLLYEAHAEMIPWVKSKPKRKALHFIIEGRNFDCFLCQADDDELEFWQALASMWERAPLMQLRLKEARDAIAQMPMDVLGTTGFPDFISDMDEDGNLREGVTYPVTQVFTRDLLLGNIERALEEPKGG